VARNVVAVKNAGLLDIREILDRGPADLTFARDITNILNELSKRKLSRPPRKLGLSAKAGESGVLPALGRLGRLRSPFCQRSNVSDLPARSPSVFGCTPNVLSIEMVPFDYRNLIWMSL
jgi:hypothetical protein